MQVCPGCGEENPEKFRLCGYCGTPLGSAAPGREIRKTVTIVFSDLKGSTSLAESIDTEALREVLSRYFEEMRRALERHGGTVEKYIGDAVMAVFGLPKLHEDDALRAVRAAADMKTALARLNGELERRYGVTLANRTGVNTGEVVAGDAAEAQRLVTGDAVNVAARLEQACPELDVLIGETTYELVREAVEVEAVEPLELKGKSERVPAYRLIAVRSGAMLRRRLDVPMVGREREVGELRSALRDAIGEHACRLVTVVAHAGVGKSRLLAEFQGWAAAEATVLEGHCLPYGEGITFWPFAEVVKEAADVLEEDSAELAIQRIGELVSDEATRVASRIAAAIGLSPQTFSIEETFWAARKFFESLAAVRPLVVVFEDIHWAEPTLLDLVEHLVASVGESVLIVCSGRPELLEQRPDWGEGARSSRLLLESLTEDESARIADNLLRGSLDDAARARVSAAAGGNPLFVEQMLSMMIDGGLIREKGGRWTAAPDLAAMHVPPTISALLAARLDALDGNERATIEPASVVGLEFYRGAVESLCPDEVRPTLDENLGALIRKQFVLPERSAFAGQDTFRFHHILIRDTAYQGLLKRSRVQMHEKLVSWIEEATGPRVVEYEEILAYHLEQAFRYRVELGPLDEHGRAVGLRAATLLSSAGRRAFIVGDVPAAAKLLGRAVDLLPEEEPLRLGLLPELAEVRLEQGEFEGADALLHEAIAGAARLGDEALRAEATLVRLVVRYATNPEGVAEEVLREAQRTIPIFERLGDDRGVARAWRLMGQVYGTESRYAEAEHAVERTIESARRAGDYLLEVRNYPPYAICALSGPRPVDEAIARCVEIVRESRNDRRTEGVVLCALAHLEAMRGDFDEARRHYRRARDTLVDLGTSVLASSTSLDAGPIEMLAGDYPEAERLLRRDYDDLGAMKEMYLRSTVTAYLGQAVLEQGRADEAQALAIECRDMAIADDAESQSIWRRVLARVKASTGEHQEAERLAREGVDCVERTDSPVMKADARVDLALVLRGIGREAEAGAALAEALAFYEAKESPVQAQSVRDLLHPAGSTSSPGG